MVRTGAKALLVGAAGAAILSQQNTFVPAPKAVHSHAPVAAALTAASLGASPVFADQIGDAAKKLTSAAMPFMNEVNWLSPIYWTKPGGSASPLDWAAAIDKAIVMGSHMDSKLLSQAAMAHHEAISTINDKGVMSKETFEQINAGIGRLIASVPESDTMAVYDAFKSVVGSDVPAYMMSKVKAEDAQAAYAALMDFKEVVKKNPITPEETVASLSEAKLNAVGTAAAKLSSASYPFLKDVDWTSDLFIKPVPYVSSLDWLNAVDKMIVMGASMDGKLLKDAAEAHHKALGSIDARGVTSESDYAAINAALGKAIATVPVSEVMDVYYTFAKLLGDRGGMIGKNLLTINSGDATAAYQAFLDFKNVVRAAHN